MSTSFRFYKLLEIHILQVNFFRGTLQRNDNIVKERLSIKLSSCVIKHEDNLVSTLAEQQKEIFEKYKDCKSDIDGMNEL